MPRTVKDLDAFQTYLSGIMSRALDRQPHVAGIALTMAAAVVWLKEGDIKVRESSGEMKNVLQVQINGQSERRMQ